MRRFAREVRGAPWWLWVIAAVALALRLASLSYGLPYELNADERYFVTAAWEMIEDGDWDPEWYGFPAATLYVVLGPLYALYGWIGIAVGAFEAWADVGDACLADGTHFFMLGRIVTALAGTSSCSPPIPSPESSGHRNSGPESLRWRSRSHGRSSNSPPRHEGTCHKSSPCSYSCSSCYAPSPKAVGACSLGAVSSSASPQSASTRP